MTRKNKKFEMWRKIEIPSYLFINILYIFGFLFFRETPKIGLICLIILDVILMVRIIGSRKEIKNYILKKIKKRKKLKVRRR